MVYDGIWWFLMIWWPLMYYVGTFCDDTSWWYDDMMIYRECWSRLCNGGCHVPLKNQNWGPWWAYGERWPKLPSKITWFSVIAGPFRRSLNVSSQKTKTWHEDLVQKKMGKKIQMGGCFSEILLGDCCNVPKLVWIIFQKLGMPTPALAASCRQMVLKVNGSGLQIVSLHQDGWHSMLRHWWFRRKTWCDRAV